MRVPRRPRVLLVDDDPEILNGLRRVVSAAEPEWNVRIARNGREALARVEQEPIDVILTDLQMPVVDGLALLRQLARSHPETIRVVHSSQSEMGGTELMRYLAHNVLSKPTRAIDPMAMLRWAVASARSSDHAEAESG